MTLPSLSSALCQALAMLRRYLGRTDFVLLHKHILSSARYHVDPHMLRPAAQAALAGLAQRRDLVLARCLLSATPAAAAGLDSEQHELALALTAAGFLQLSDGIFQLGPWQLVSFFGSPQFIDRRVDRDAAATEVYVGADTAVLAYYLDCDGLSGARRALDLGTGSGALALYLARHVDQVVATDVLPAALWLAAVNCQLAPQGARVVLRCEDVRDTVVRGERYDVVTFNPPFLAAPAGDDLNAPAYAAGAGADGLDHCRALLSHFHDLVEPTGAAYLVSALPGDDEQPHLLAELPRYAARLRLQITALIDGRVDLRGEGGQGPLLGHARHLLARNPGLKEERALSHVQALYRQVLGADCIYLTTLVIRAGVPSVRYWDGNARGQRQAGGPAGSDR